MKHFEKIALIALLFLGSLVQALSPQQYCEKLHSERHPGSATSFERLNVDVPTSSVVTIPSNETCSVHHLDQSCIPLAVGSTSGARSNVRVYNIEVRITKMCKNGNFVHATERRTQWISNCFHTSFAGCPIESVVCQGSGCLSTPPSNYLNFVNFETGVLE
jgi:hypothetical protein